MILIFVFFSSFILFFIEFAAAQALLPLFGGSTMVWGVSLLFYNTFLLGGYIFSHFLSSLKFKTMIFTAAGLYILLPFTAGYTFDDYDITSEYIKIFAMLFFSVGPVFFLFSASATFFQSLTEKMENKNSYYIYSWSNYGALAALIGYPLLLRPYIHISDHFEIIRISSFITAIAGAAIILKTFYQQAPKSGRAIKITHSKSPGPDNSKAYLFRWLLISTALNSLLLAVTNYLLMDMPPVPLFWILPLGIFLYNFAAVWNTADKRKKNFSGQQLLPGLLLIIFTLSALGFLCNPFLMRLVTIVLFYGISRTLLFCLYNIRPDTTAGDSTLFYIFIALGGCVGTFLVSFISPMFFNSFIELPISIILCIYALEKEKTKETCLVKETRKSQKAFVKTIILTVVNTFLIIFLIYTGIDPVIESSGNYAYFAACLLIFLSIYFHTAIKPKNIIIAFALILSFMKSPAGLKIIEPNLVLQKRNFYGIHRIIVKKDIKLLQHGMICHGKQYINKDKELIPLSYYHWSTPLGIALLQSEYINNRRAALIGLGTGALSMYQKADEKWTFYELDEFVLYMGQTHFNYLKNSRGKINFITGDARINLAACEDEKFDIIVMDAFSGDTVPTHLITLEAIKSYKRKLKKQGIIIFHISSLYFDLSKPISAAAAETGFKCLVKKDIINPNPHVDPCKAIVLIKG
jgi:hypothetical protein